MVVAYLEKLREDFQEEYINFTTEMNIAKNELKENIEIIKILEANIDRNFESFTPRQVDGFNKRKIDELKIEQSNIQDKLNMLSTQIMMLDEKIDELNKVIKVAKEQDKIIRELNS